MGLRGELFTTQITVENRTYFFNVKENRTGDVFLQVVESKSTDGSGFDRHAIVIFEDDMQKFLQGLEGTLQFIEKNRKSKLKASAEKIIAARKKGPRNVTDSRSRTLGKDPAVHDAHTEEKPAVDSKPRRVKVISRKKTD